MQGRARILSLSLMLLAATLAGCASRPGEPQPAPPRQSALAPRADDAFAAIEAAIRAAHGPEASGFELLDRNEDGLRWRLALIDSARHSIDAQYYLWLGDTTGLLLIKRLLAAADRGVRVRILVDDLNTLLPAAQTLEVADDFVALVDAHPNLEIRLFNPWRGRGLLERLGESVTELERVNQRMHNKALIVDNRAAILGGRNIGDEYMGLNPKFNFHDLDVLGIGPVARQASAVFDDYWNSPWVGQASALGRPVDEAARAQLGEALAQKLTQRPAAQTFAIAARSWQAELAALTPRLHAGTSRVHADRPTPGQIDHEMVDRIYELAGTTRRELLIVNAYIIPGERTIRTLAGMKERGIEVRILTNSLASHDVPAVNSHYKAWRKPLREAGHALHEMRHDAAVQATNADTAPIRAGFMGLHSKAMVIDRERLYIGSMNFDPRSVSINSEMGVFIDSPGLARATAALIERDLLPANSWRVEVDPDGSLRWINDREQLKRQPARDWWQRVEDIIFMAFPKSLY